MFTRIGHSRTALLQWILTAVAATGIVLPFLPFAFGTSPAEALLMDAPLLQVAAPFFLSLLVTAGTIRWLHVGQWPVLAERCAYALGFASVCMTMLVVIHLLVESRGTEIDIHEWLTIAIPVLAVLLGGALLVRCRRREESRSFSPLLVLQVAYLANALLCLIAFLGDQSFGDWPIGARLTVVTSVAYLLQALVATAGHDRPEVA